MTFKKIFLYLEVFFISIPFIIRIAIFVALLTCFFKEVLKKTDICKQGFTIGQLYLTYCRPSMMIDSI